MGSDPQHGEIATFICPHVLDATHPVFLLAREQGDWIILCDGMHYSDDDYHVAGRNHLLEADATLYQALDLDNDWEVEREFVGGPWTRRAIED